MQASTASSSNTMLQAYMAELSKVKFLTPEEEANHWRRYKYEGSDESRAKIIESYQPLVYKIVSSLKADSEVLLDLLQEGAVGLIEATERFDPSKGIKFTTYAPFRIRGRIINYLDKNNVNTVALDSTTQTMSELMGLAHELLDPSRPARNVEKIAEDQMLVGVILSSLQRLSEKERRVIFGIYVEDKKATDLAKEMGISNSYLSRLQKKGVRRLRGMLSRMIREMKA